MMYKVAGIVLLTIFAVLMLKKENSEYAFLIQTASSAGLLIFILPFIGNLISDVNALLKEVDIDSQYIRIVLKCCAIALLTRLLTALCSDAGENSLRAIVEICARIFILITAFPVFKAVIALIRQIMENIA